MEKIHTSQKEQARAEAYFNELFSDMSALPFSFKYDGRQYRGLDGDFSAAWEEGRLTGRLPTGWEVRAEIKRNFEYASFEWTLYFKNTSEKESGVLSDIMGADFTINKPDPELFYFIGDDAMDHTPMLRARAYACGHVFGIPACRRAPHQFHDPLLQIRIPR